MADETQRRIIYLEINASKAVDGSTAATRALANVEKGATSAGSAMGALEAASVAAGGAAQRTALDLATSATAATNLNAAYRATSGGVLELARSTTAAANSAQAQAAAFARLAEQRTVQASLAQTRALMDGVARSTENLAHVYGASTIRVKNLAEMQASAVAASYGAMAASAARYAAGVGGTVQSLQVAEAYQRSLRPAPQYSPAPGVAPVIPAPRQATGYMGTPGQTGLNAQQKVMLGYQLQDVGVSLIGGMNPLVVAAQQGPQISMLYGGVGNMMRAIPKPLLYGGGLAAGAAAGLYGLNAAASADDGLIEQERRFVTLLGSQREAAAAYQDIRKAAADAGVAVDVTTAAFVSFARATQSLGAGRADIMSITATVEKLTQLAGANDNESNAAGGAVADMLRQSVVGAEDLRKVLGSVPQVADQIAAGLGVSVAQLRLMAAEGDLTNRQVFAGLLKQAGGVNAEFAKMPKSVASSFTSIADDLGTMTLRLTEQSGVLKSYREILEGVARAAKGLREATTPETPEQVAGRLSGTSVAGGPSASTMAGRPSSDPLGRYGGAVGDARLRQEYADAVYQAGVAANQRQFAEMGAQAEPILANLEKAVGIASKLSPLSGQLKELNKDAAAVAQAISDIVTGKFQGSPEQSARYLDMLAASADRLKDKIKDAGDAVTQASRQLGLTAIDRATDNTPAGMAIGARTRQLLADPNNYSSEGQANAQARAELASKAEEAIQSAKLQADAQDKITAATGRGTAAMIKAQVELAKLSFQYEYFGREPTAEAIRAINEFGAALERKLTGEAAASAIDAAKQYQDELAGLAAQMTRVAEGTYAMRRAEAEARAARAQDGTGALQLQAFDARQALTDATSLQNLREEIDLTNSLAKAAGDVAEQKRLQLDFDIRRAQQNASPSMRGDVAAAMRSDYQAKSNRDLAEGAATLERQVVLTRQQADIVRAGSADYSIQLAMLNKKNELIAQGIDIESDANAQRQIAAAGELARANTELERAREAADSTKRIWQNAYDNIQSYAGDVFYDIFSGAGFNAQSAAEGMKRIFLRTFAELAAAAIIKPIIQPVFQAGQALGIVPAGVGGTNGFGVPSAANSNGISIPGGSSLGWFGEQLSGVGNWLRSPITPTTYSAGYGAAADYASLSGTAMPSGLTSGGQLGGLTWGQGLAGLGQIGMGAYSLINSKSTGQTIGGIGSMVGGVVSMLPIPGAQIVGPLISLASSLLPSLFGESNTRTHSSTNASLRYGNGSWYTRGGAYGAGANSSQSESQLRGLSGGIDSVFGLLGGVKDPSRVWGLDASSWTASGKDWAYTSNATHLVDPSGNREAYRMNMDGMFDTGSAQVAIRSILSGAVGEISATMKTALEAMRGFDAGLQETAKNITFVDEVYERLGKGALTVRTQFRELESKFGDMTETAKKLGLALEPVAAEQKKQTERLGQDYIDNLIDPIAAQLRAWEDEKQSILANTAYIAEHTDVIVDMARINEALLRKEADLKEQLYGGAISQLEDAIKRLTYGDLSNITGAGTLAGMQASFNATVAQARAGDLSAYQRVASEGLALTEANRGYYASGPEYEATRREILAIFSELQLQVSGGVGASPSESSAANAATAASLATTQQLQAMVRDLAEQLAESKRDQAETNDLIRRLLSRNAA